MINNSLHVEEVTLVGCGSMGSAMLRGWLKCAEIQTFNVIAPHPEAVKPYMDKDKRVKWFNSIDRLETPISCLVIALKPSALEEVLPAYRDRVTDESLIISVATGKVLAFYKELLGQDIIRAMPNTPVAINKGVVGLVAKDSVRTKYQASAEKLFGHLGYVTWLNTEEQLKQVTALSGSGPAYVFYMIEAMAKAGENLGLTEHQAYEMALFTVAGAGAYAVESGLSVSALRENVTSPNGTTQQALKVLMSSGGLEPLIRDAMEAALYRAQELAK